MSKLNFPSHFVEDKMPIILWSSILELNGTKIENVQEMCLLGTTITADLTWERNTQNIVKKANSRMQLLHKLSEFKPRIEDLKQIYILYIRSILEQSSNIWHTSLSKDDEDNLERVQKSAFKFILRQKYKTYENACQVLNLQTLKDRRKELFRKFT